jgi:ribosome-binding factor A
MSTLRLERVREMLKREIGEIVRREIPVGDAGLISVNDVQISSDLHSAAVRVGILGNAEQKKRAMAELHKHRKRIQGMVGSAIVLKYTPQLRFIADDSIEEGNKVIKIIEELEKTPFIDEEPPENH